MESLITPASYQFGPFRIDTVKRVLARDGDPLSLMPKAFDTLLVLVQRSGQTVDKNELMRLVWCDSIVEENNLTQSISALRRILGESPKDHRYIVTVPGLGYRFVAPVNAGAGGASSIAAAATTAADIPMDSGSASRGKTSAHSPRVRRAIGWALVSLAVAAAAVAVHRRGTQPRSSASLAAPFQQMTVTRLTTSGSSIAAAISPDGKYLVHVIEERGQQSLWIRQVSSALNVPIIPSASVEYWGLTFSRDGNDVYYVIWQRGRGDAELFQVPALGGLPKKLITNIDAPVALSPDGQTLAFVVSHSTRGTSTLMLAAADGSHARTLAVRAQPNSFAMRPRGPAWSPDGGLIALAGGTSSDGAQYMNVVGVRVADGSEIALGRQHWADVGRVAWLADGGGLVVPARVRPSSPRQLWSLSYPAGEARKITNDPNDYSGISLTADSRSMVAVQTTRRSGIWVIMPGGTSEARQVTSEIGSDFGFYEGINWTPQGEILFRSVASGNWDIWSVDPGTGRRRQLTVDPGGDTHPSASPDGRYVVFSSDRTGTFAIWRMDRDGAGPMQLTSGGDDLFPQVSPDGRWVVYQHGLKAGEKATLWKVPLEGGDPVQVSEEYLARPALSPDGAWIAAYHRRPGRPLTVAVLPAAGGKPFREFPISPVPKIIRWTADGRALTYIDDRNGVSNLWAQPISGSPPQQLTSFATDLIFDFDWSRDGKQLACTRGTVMNDIVKISDFR